MNGNTYDTNANTENNHQIEELCIQQRNLHISQSHQNISSRITKKYLIPSDEDGVIGVAELCNKQTNSHFTTFDEEMAMAFSSYCGLAILHR